MYLRPGAAVLISLFATLGVFTSDAAAADLDLSAYRGKVVYIDFWASWCTPCRESFPWMNWIAQTLGPKGLVVIGVNVDHDRDLAETFLKSNVPDFNIVYDTDGAIARKYNFSEMPTSVLIGRDGKVQSVHGGFYPNREGEYFADISSLLHQGAPPK